MRSFQIKYVVALIDGDERHISLDEFEQYERLRSYGWGWNKTLSTPLESLLADDKRTLNALTNDNILYLGDLTMVTESSLYRVPGIGVKGVSRIKKLLVGLGLTYLLGSRSRW